MYRLLVCVCVIVGNQMWSSGVYSLGERAGGQLVPVVYGEEMLGEKDNAGEGFYQESYLRRFDITFFLSFPVFVLYNVLVHQLFASYGGVNGNTGTLNAHQFVYMGISSAMLAFGVAYSDYVNVSKEVDIVSGNAAFLSFSWKFYF